MKRINAMNQVVRAPKPHNVPGPAKNLGPHLKPPKDNEIVTEHRYADRKKAQP